MEVTSAFIASLSRLKVNGKSKKHAGIKVAVGKRNVPLTKTIPSVMNAHTPRVTLKIEVGYKEHSHIIGLGGRVIQEVMDKTGCKIHFPDCNRMNVMEKSNQVFIYGGIDAVESARARVRELSPLNIFFEMPHVNKLRPFPDPKSLIVTQVEKSFNVQVTFPKWGQMKGMCVSVKGYEEQFEDVETAAMILMDYYCAGATSTVLMRNTMEISPRHQSADLLQAIMNGTNTQIMVLDATDPSVSALQKNNVTIAGGLKNVHAARQQLIGSLPVGLMFDVHKVGKADMLTRTKLLENFLGVKIKVQTRNEQSVSVFIEGTERNISKVYEAGRQILGITGGPPVQVKIPEEYRIPPAMPLYGLWN